MACALPVIDAIHGSGAAHHTARRLNEAGQQELKRLANGEGATSTLRRIIGVTGARAMARHFLRRLPFVGLSRADMDRRRRDMAARAIARRQGHTGVDGLRAEDFHPAPLARGE